MVRGSPLTRPPPNRHPRIHEWTGSIEHMPGVFMEGTVEWSDPRLPAKIMTLANVDLHHGTDSFDDWMTTSTQVHRLDGPEGAWTGVRYALSEVDTGSMGLSLWTGKSAYEGLAAILLRDTTDEVTTWEGFIVEAEPPAAPPPPEG